MNETKFNFAYVFSVVVLLVFSYITFLGLAYWTGGSLTTPILLTLLLIVLVAGGIMVMSLSRSTRWTDIGLVGQCCFGLVVLASLMCATIPFTNFLRVASEKQQLQSMMVETANAAAEIDKSYNSYAEGRLTAYRNSLNAISVSKKAQPTVYAEAFGQAAGATDQDKINALCASLRAKLLPMDAEEVVNERHDWLNRAADLNVWNPMTASNIASMKDQMNTWTQNYRELSSVQYKGEKTEVFAYDNFDSKLNELTDSYQTFRRPSGVSIVAALLCFVIMLLPYLIARGSMAAEKSGGKNASIFE